MTQRNDLVGQVFGAGSRIDRKGLAFTRRAALVCQHPLEFYLHDLNDNLLSPGTDARKLLLTSSLVALNQVRHDLAGDVEHWVVREDSPLFDYQPSRMAEAKFGPWTNKTILPPERFDPYAELFLSGLSNPSRLKEFILHTEVEVPEMQIAPKRVHELLDREGYEFLPRYFARHNLENFDCLVWIQRSNNQLPKKELERLRLIDIPCLHLGGGWYAFESIEDAMALKLLANDTEVHPIRD
jgi:hypothetical protein